MKIFVIGPSHSGKSPLARRAAEALGVPCHGASAWVREKWPPGSPVEEMTSWAADQLRRDPGVSVKALRARADLDGPCVIEGMRNPYDFVSCFDARCDLVVSLQLGDHKAATAFERGLDVIRAYLDWLRDAGLLGGTVFDYRYASYGEAGVDAPDTLEHAIVDFIARACELMTQGRDPAAHQVHAQIPPIETHVHAEYLYGMDPARVGEVRRCNVFAVSSYTGSTPTFQILLEDGAVFSYLPPNALVDPTKTGEPHLELADLVYHDCKSTPICVHSFDALRGRVLAYFKRKDLWLGGDYVVTIDWFTTNELMHVLALDNGQYALLPSHKVKFGDHPPGFEPYRKIRREWTVGNGD
ncbi:MAG TPA: hypothetical protein VLB44_05835 [Kofleriaceae bacterium]|nr:hypothetical protein [Kofleriaceae bacterium]